MKKINDSRLLQPVEFHLNTKRAFTDEFFSYEGFRKATVAMLKKYKEHVVESTDGLFEVEELYVGKVEKDGSMADAYIRLLRVSVGNDVIVQLQLENVGGPYYGIDEREPDILNVGPKTDANSLLKLYGEVPAAKNHFDLLKSKKVEYYDSGEYLPARDNRIGW